MRTRGSRKPTPPAGDPYDAAVRYLGTRPRSVSEIRRHLRAKRFDDAAIDGAVDRLRAQGYLDDEAFARYWMEQREQFRPKGERALVSELLGKGVARTTIEAILGERKPDAEIEQARKAVRRPITRWLSLAPDERKRKIHAYLAARGFGYATIEAVILREVPQRD